MIVRRGPVIAIVPRLKPSVTLNSNLEVILMLRKSALFCFLTLCISTMAVAEEASSCEHCESNVTKLRLYFPPDVMSSGRDSSGFKPEIAKIFVEDSYVGDAIVNLHDFVPSFRFPKSTVKIRIEMSDARQFEKKMTFLGHGSTQVLYVDFTDRADTTGSARETALSIKTSAGQPSSN